MTWFTVYCFQIKDNLTYCPKDWLTYKLKVEAFSTSEGTKVQGHCCPCRRQAENSNDQTETGSMNQNSNKRIHADCDTNFYSKRQKQEEGSYYQSKETKGDNLSSENYDECVEKAAISLDNETDSYKTCSKTVKDTGSEETFDNLYCLQNYGKNMRQSPSFEEKVDGPCLKLYNFLEDGFYIHDLFKEYQVSEKDLKRFMVMDIVNPCSSKTCCFTKR